MTDLEFDIFRDIVRRFYIGGETLSDDDIDFLIHMLLNAETRNMDSWFEEMVQCGGGLTSD